MLLALFFLGTWPAILTLLERRGRLPQHTYLDYTIANLLAAILIAFTFGQIHKGTPEAPNFLEQLSQENFPLVMFLQYWAFVGLSVTEVMTARIVVIVSCFFIAFILNISFLYRPMLNDWNGRGWAFLAGLLCGFGNGLQFMGGKSAGYEAADAVQVKSTLGICNKTLESLI
ncbi:hypothetical protein SAY87_018026 [Trapa incisa]|uniref:Uncharacterized protein n=1 Tax=Trapa incisa TaxID=236973 RepID=A0AAN7L5C7_9MYRT|nr:hypothetical protein SAY87_018026 [Trapa incisa]